MYKFVIVLITLIVISLPTSITAQQNDVTVGDVAMSGLSWGKQIVNIELENKTEYVKFIVTKTDLLFEGVYANPEFIARTTYLLEPLQKISISPDVYIPGNYGAVTINLAVYDVVDTLDELMPWNQIHTQTFTIKYHPSDEILPYLQEKVTFPPRVDVHPYFNNEFVRLLFTLLAEGKTVTEIATLTDCDTSFVNSQIQMYLKNKYLIADGESYKTNFPFISKTEAEDGKKIADMVSDKLVTLLSTNIGSYYDVIDSLIAAKTIPNDKNDFISGAVLLHKPTPLVSTFVLWYELGKNFITRSAPLLIYDGTDICKAANMQYMYMVDGGAFVNGSHFFGLFYGSKSYSLMFSEDALQIECNENFQDTPSPRLGVWKYDLKNLPEFYIVDTTNIRPLIDVMARGSDEILAEAYNELKINSKNHGHDKTTIGHRYWFWNLVATLTLDKLYKKGTLIKPKKSYYRFDKIK